jgi:hypothetical protein
LIYISNLVSFNEIYYPTKRKKFKSFEQYFQSFVYPLLEETRAQICSSMEILWMTFSSLLLLSL